MVFDLKWPKFLSAGPAPAQRPAAVAARRPGSAVARGVNFLGRYSVTKQLQILGGLLLLLMLIIAAVIYHDNRESTYGSVYIATSGEMRMLSQRLAKASSLALQGNTSAFKQLRDSHNQFVRNLDLLLRGPRPPAGIAGIDILVASGFPDRQRLIGRFDALGHIREKVDKGKAAGACSKVFTFVLGHGIAQAFGRTP